VGLPHSVRTDLPFARSKDFDEKVKESAKGHVISSSTTAGLVPMLTLGAFPPDYEEEWSVSWLAWARIAHMHRRNAITHDQGWGTGTRALAVACSAWSSLDHHQVGQHGHVGRLRGARVERRVAGLCWKLRACGLH